MGAYFAFIFSSEYRVSIVSSYVVSYLFLAPYVFPLAALHFLSLSFLTLAILTITIWVRVTYVRFRYDLLIIIAWKSLLPVSLIFLILTLLV